jgi:integrase
MATVKLILHRAYKKGSESEKVDDLPTEQNLTDRIRSGKKRKRILVSKEVRLYAALIVRMGEVVKIRSQHTILPEEWDFKRQLKKDNIAGSIEFNIGLLQLKSDILEKFDQTVKDHPDMSFPGIYQIMKDFGKKKEIPFAEHDRDFFQFLDDYIEFLKGEVTYRSVQKYTTLKNSLIDFGKQNKKYQNLSFSMIDSQFKDAYVKYLRSQKPRGRQKTRPEKQQDGLLIDTESKYIGTLKSFCAWADEKGINRYPVYKQFKKFSSANRKRKEPDQEIVTLTLQELTKFYEYDFRDRPTLDHVRDLFCFGCYTGQRWTDIELFDKNDLTGDVWSFNVYNTKKVINIDLIGFAAHALDILKKYNYRLPKISLVKFNEYIKLAAGIAGISDEINMTRYRGADPIIITKPKYEFISSQCARKTCISLLLNEFNIPITHILQISGHSDLKTLQKYIDKDSKSRREFMSKTIPLTEVPLKIVQ